MTRHLVARVVRAVREHDLLVRGERCLVAVSGGPDSVALLDLLAAVAPRVGVALAVGHVDHGVRGEEGRAAAALVARLAERYGLPYGEAALPRAPAGSLPAEALLRRGRYAALARLARAAGCAAVAVGHHREDQAETVLLRLLRGAGPRGLAGMARARVLAHPDGGPPLRLIRPLLDLSRTDLAARVAERGLPVHLDPTNADRRWLRNALRLDVLPGLRARVNPRLDEALAATAEILRDEDARLAAEAAVCFADLTGERPPAGEVRLPVAGLAGLPPALQRRVLRLAGEAAAPGAPPPTFAQLDAARRLALRARTGAPPRCQADARHAAPSPGEGPARGPGGASRPPARGADGVSRRPTAEPARGEGRGTMRDATPARGPVRWPGSLAVRIEAGWVLVGPMPARQAARARSGGARG